MTGRRVIARPALSSLPWKCAVAAHMTLQLALIIGDDSPRPERSTLEEYVCATDAHRLLELDAPCTSSTTSCARHVTSHHAPARPILQARTTVIQLSCNPAMSSTSYILRGCIYTASPLHARAMRQKPRETRKMTSIFHSVASPPLLRHQSAMYRARWSALGPGPGDACQQQRRTTAAQNGHVKVRRDGWQRSGPATALMPVVLAFPFGRTSDEATAWYQVATWTIRQQGLATLWSEHGARDPASSLVYWLAQINTELARSHVDQFLSVHQRICM